MKSRIPPPTSDGRRNRRRTDSSNLTEHMVSAGDRSKSSGRFLCLLKGTRRRNREPAKIDPLGILKTPKLTRTELKRKHNVL
jgi:hypothetical protein